MGRNMKAFSKTNLLPFFVSFVASCETPSLASLRLCERKSKRRTNPPAGERGIAPRKNAATGDSRCVVARTGRAWLCDHRCERRTGIARNRPFGPATAGGDGADSRPARQTEGDFAPLAQTGVPIAPAPAVSRRCGARQTSTGRQAEARSEALTAHRTRCGRAYNRYGSLCQASSATRITRITQPTPSPRA